MKLPVARGQTTTDESPRFDLNREEYFAERRLLIEARQRGYQRAEQLMVAGAGAALGLSVTFLDKFVVVSVNWWKSLTASSGA